MIEKIIKTPEEMQEFAAEIAANAKVGDVFALTGNLGSGKTTFAQGFIKALVSEDENITSPTFNIIQVYSAPDFQVWHCDFYRLRNKAEIEDLGLEDAFKKAVTIIEWPEIAEHLLPANTQFINIYVIPKTENRQVRMVGS